MVEFSLMISTIIIKYILIIASKNLENKIKRLKFLIFLTFLTLVSNSINANYTCKFDLANFITPIFCIVSK